MSETPQHNIGPSGKCYFCIFIFVMSCFVFKHIYDLKEGKKQNMSPKVCICFAIVTLPTNGFLLDILKGHRDIPTVVFLGQNGFLAEVSIQAVPQSLHVAAAHSTPYMLELRWEKLPKRLQWKQALQGSLKGLWIPRNSLAHEFPLTEGFCSSPASRQPFKLKVVLWPVAILLAVAKVLLLVFYLVVNESSDIWNLVSIHLVSILKNNFLWVYELPVFS